MLHLRFVSLVGFALLALAPIAGAGEETRAGGSERSPFDGGMREFQFGGGLFVSENYYDILRPQINDVQLSARLGWMLYSPAGPSILRGNVEFLAELFGGPIVKGPGDLIAGGTMLLRYNYVWPRSRFVPYFQVGAGGAYSNAFENRTQRELGGAGSFNLQTGFGARYLISEKCGIFLEFDYRHLSNAGIADRNVGLNSGGSILGASIFF